LLGENEPGLVEVTGFEEEDGAAVEHEAGTIVEAEVRVGKRAGHGVESARLVWDFDGEHLHKGNGEAMAFESVEGLVGSIDEEPDDAELANIGDADPMDVELGVGERGGDAGELIGFVLGEDGD